MKKGFSLLELIFAIVVIGIIASFAIPKYMDTRNSALASTIKRDIVTATTSIQSYYLVNREIAKISDAINLNEQNWTITDSKITFTEEGNTCVDLEVKEGAISLTITPGAGDVCTYLDSLGVKTQTIDLI